ncbi:MAG TPA: hypothetical protein VFS11_10265 [Gemmatimonadales bacterium]|nr:hypothetical protein [Gemmatimonadales bacterium]
MTQEPQTLEHLLADWRGDAAVLRRQGMAERAALLEQHADAVRRVAEPWLRKLWEDEACLKSGHHPRWFKARHAEWEEMGLAGTEGRRRWYRDAIVPQRKHLSAAREDARTTARREALADAPRTTRTEARKSA